MNRALLESVLSNEKAAAHAKADASASSGSPVTHKQAVRRVAAWMKITRYQPVRCSIVFAELATANIETPDVIGWNSGRSVLVECKVSRSDFLADKNKRFRQLEETGMGDRRYYAAPKGMLRADELPEGWGLIEITLGTCSIARAAEPKNGDKAAECRMLCSAIRRVEISTAVFVAPEENISAQGREASPGALGSAS